MSQKCAVFMNAFGLEKEEERLRISHLFLSLRTGRVLLAFFL